MKKKLLRAHLSQVVDKKKALAYGGMNTVLRMRCLLEDCIQISKNNCRRSGGDAVNGAQ
jgi:hypothetical protein